MVGGLVLVSIVLIKVNDTMLRYEILAIFGSLMATIGAALFIFITQCRREE